MFVRKAWVICYCDKCQNEYIITLTKTDAFAIEDFIESLQTATIVCYTCHQRPRILNVIMPFVEEAGDYGISATGEWRCKNPAHKMTYYPLVMKRAVEEQILVGPSDIHEKDMYRTVLAKGLPWTCPICFERLKHTTRTARRYETYTLFGKI